MLTACGSLELRCTTLVSEAILEGEAASWLSSLSVGAEPLKFELWQPASAAAATSRTRRATPFRFTLDTVMGESWVTYGRHRVTALSIGFSNELGEGSTIARSLSKP